jgi:hypothetical protein
VWRIAAFCDSLRPVHRSRRLHPPSRVCARLGEAEPDRRITRLVADRIFESGDLAPTVPQMALHGSEQQLRISLLVVSQIAPQCPHHRDCGPTEAPLRILAHKGGPPGLIGFLIIGQLGLLTSTELLVRSNRQLSGMAYLDRRNPQGSLSVPTVSLQVRAGFGEPS